MPQERNNRVKIADIAQRAGVSAGTVDRVLHNRGEVSDKTRMKVERIIREMNYEPDLLASTLASKKNYLFVSVLPEPSPNNLFWYQPVMGLEKAFKRVKHYGVEYRSFFFDFYSKDSFRDCLQHLLEIRPDGIILAPLYADLTEQFMGKAMELGIAVVFINTHVPNLPKLSFVGQDAFRSGLVAAQLLDLCACCPVGTEIVVVNIMNEKGGSAHLMSREEGFRSYFSLKNSHQLTILSLNVQENSSPEIKEALRQGLLDKNGKLRAKGIFVTNSRVYHVAGFLEEVGKGNTRLIGYDLLEQSITHLHNGNIDFLISQNPVAQGYNSFMALFDALVLKKEVEKFQYLSIDIITRENIDYYLNQPVHE